MTLIESAAAIAGLLVAGGSVWAASGAYWNRRLRRPLEPLDPTKEVTVPKLEYKEVTRAIEDFAERLKNNMPEYIVGIDRGGAIAAGLLAKRLRFHRDCPKLRLIHRADKHECGFASGIIEDELKGKSVLVVDDACRRGDTMAGALGYIEKTLQPAQVRTFVILLVKGNCARPVPILGRIDYHAYFTTKLTVTLPWDAGAQS